MVWVHISMWMSSSQHELRKGAKGVESAYEEMVSMRACATGKGRSVAVLVSSANTTGHGSTLVSR
jgi:hypothetical protein